jgi:hypothetical protein
MKEKDQFLKKYRKFLDDQSEHLSFELLSLYLNFSENFSHKENQYFDQHLSICQDCQEKFKEVFDTELDLEQKTTLFLREVNTQTLPTDSVLQFTFTSRVDPKGQSQNIRSMDGTISLDLLFKTDHILLNIMDFPDEYLGRAVKLTVPEIQSTERVHRLKRNAPITLSLMAEERPAQISKILFEFASPTPEPVEKQSWSNKINIGDIQPGRLAAAAVVLMIITAAYFIFYPDRPGPDQPLISQQLQGEAFQENPLLENFIDRTLRFGDQITLLSPSIGDTVAVPVTFHWQQPEDKATYVLTILDNQNREIWRNAVPENRMVFRGELQPGLYYWKLQVGERSAVVSKFFIK